ncbi:MAG: VOC family protein [Nannocystaceae bacterium]|nr:VOC family protein [Myxococcales bacterium]
MIGYVTLGTCDLHRAAAFYDDLLGLLGARRAFETERFIAWGAGSQGGLLAVAAPFDGAAATVGNGVMVALSAPDPDTVDRVYARALELGGADAGPAGPRGAGGFYAGYFRDLDGNKLNAFCYRR